MSRETARAWPPLREDLERLYVEKGLSALKIAKAYRLRYASEKTAESTILYHLKRNGIARRDPAAHVRKVTAAMGGAWAERYARGESLKQIAGGAVSPVTVLHHLRRRGVKLRDRVEAQIKAVQKFEKRPFSGDEHERAYITGLAVGDFATTRHGRAVRVRLGTTHPAMARLFRSLFEGHGPIYEYPRENTVTGFEWSLDCDLDASFSFLLNLKETARSVLPDERLFPDFLAGFFDAEGSIYYHRKGTGGAFELSLSNLNVELLREISIKLELLGAFSKLYRARVDAKKAQERGVANSGEAIWILRIWRNEAVNRVLGLLPLRHPEKVAKVAIAQRLAIRPTKLHRISILADWSKLIERIALDRVDYVASAREALAHRQAGP